ncbi:hypothetical protein HOF65_04435 [bacterium]|nr:hypothetical protein [bacterium]
MLTELETIQVAKDETGKFADTQTKADMEELGLDPKDFKDTEQNQRKTEIMKELNEM